ncbi:65-kDa microtubule-associated protein 5 [Linum perenne]
MATSPPLISPSRTTCGSLLRELEVMWDEIGEQDGERDRMLQQLEQECLDIYRRKVDMTRKHKAELAHSLVEEETEIANIISALGETATFSQRVKGTLKQQLSVVGPVLQDLRQKKQARMSEFYETQMKIALICAEIAGNSLPNNPDDLQVDEHDLTVKRLGELKSHLKELLTEKVLQIIVSGCPIYLYSLFLLNVFCVFDFQNLRLHKVSSSIGKIHELSVVMSIDFSTTLTDLHPSLSDHTQPKSISNDTLARLTDMIQSLKQEKQERLHKVIF